MPSILEANISGVCTFAGERMENGNRHIAFLDFDRQPVAMLGSLVQSNAMSGTPWWADEDLQAHIGGPYTSDGDDPHAAVEVVRGMLR